MTLVPDTQSPRDLAIARHAAADTVCATFADSARAWPEHRGRVDPRIVLNLPRRFGIARTATNMADADEWQGPDGTELAIRPGVTSAVDVRGKPHYWTGIYGFHNCLLPMRTRGPVMLGVFAHMSGLDTTHPRVVAFGGYFLEASVILQDGRVLSAGGFARSEAGREVLLTALASLRQTR